jgi:hypothetical protein
MDNSGLCVKCGCATNYLLIGMVCANCSPAYRCVSENREFPVLLPNRELPLRWPTNEEAHRSIQGP